MKGGDDMRRKELEKERFNGLEMAVLRLNDCDEKSNRNLWTSLVGLLMESLEWILEARRPEFSDQLRQIERISSRRIVKLMLRATADDIDLTPFNYQ